MRRSAKPKRVAACSVKARLAKLKRSKLWKTLPRARGEGSQRYSGVALVREPEVPKLDWPEGLYSGNPSASFERHGFAFHVRLVPEETYDLPGNVCGTYLAAPRRGRFAIKRFSDTAHEGRTSLQYFEPMIDPRDTERHLRAMGYARGPAHELAWSYAYEDFRRAERINEGEHTVWCVTMTVSRKGVELASDSLGMVDGDEDYWNTIVAQMVPGLVRQAKDALHDLCACKGAK